MERTSDGKRRRKLKNTSGKDQEAEEEDEAENKRAAEGFSVQSTEAGCLRESALGDPHLGQIPELAGSGYIPDDGRQDEGHQGW